MSRFLFVVPPLTGHINPTVSVGRELEARGHEVAWVGHPTVVRALLPAGAKLYPLDDRIPEKLHQEMLARAHAARGLVALKLLWEDFLLPLAHAMVPGVTDAVRALEPDALLVDQQAMAGGLVARREGLPWATMATTSAAVTDSLSELPTVAAWLYDHLARLQAHFGLEPLPGQNESPHAVVVFSTKALAGADLTYPKHFHFVGPAIHHRDDPTDFPFEILDPERAGILVSLGTINAERGARFFRAVVDGLADRPVQVVFAAAADLVGPLPEHMLARPWVPQLRVLPRMSAVITHAGHNTVCETLLHGLPMVLAPIRDDQPVVARQVVAAGAGVRVRFGRVGPRELGKAVDRVLNEPAFRAAAEHVQASFRNAGGAGAAAEAAEGLA